MRTDVFELEALRLNRRYVVEVVEHFALCPWADRARRDGRVTDIVFAQTSADHFDTSLERMRDLEVRSEIDVALFIYPEIAVNRLDFEHFARRLRALDAERHAPDRIPFAIAAFHPDAAPVLVNPDRLVPFLRRTPYPTLQLVRESTLLRVRGEHHGTSFFGPEVFLKHPDDRPEPDVRERIARMNFATVTRVGVEALEAVFADILRDRDETRARLRRGEGG